MKIVATAIVMVYNFVTRKIFLDGDTGAVLRVSWPSRRSEGELFLGQEPIR